MMIVLYIVIGAVLGALIMWLLMHGRLKVAQTLLEERTAAQQRLHQEAVEALERRQAEALQTMEKHHAEALRSMEQRHDETDEAQERHHREALAAQQARFDETMAKVSAQLKEATRQMLTDRQREFSEASAGSLGQIVNPLRETLDKMQRAMAETETRQSAEGGAMKAIIQQMMQSSEAARHSTEELTRVFRHSNTVQGNWGETVLDELLEAQGLTRGIHYDVQPTIRDASGTAVLSETGARLRPDVILHLDQRREVIVDSKVSLAAFMDYVNATDEGDRQRYLRAHVASLQEQVNRLATKDYSAYIQPPKVKMDYVIMFVPHTGALWTALNAQPDLWRKAMERGVYIADEQTLFAALRIISLTWTQIRQAENHEKVYSLASEMMDRVGQFMKKFQLIGASLGKAQQAYDDAERKLLPQGQSILQTCVKLQRLGAKQSDKNPLPQLVDIDDLSALEEQTLT